MHEIKCPNCGQVFTVDESGYTAILAQVRNDEFHRALKEREAQMKAAEQAALALLKANAEQDKTKSLAERMQEIERLKAQIEAEEERAHHRRAKSH